MGLKESELWSKVDALTDKITDLQKQKTQVLQEIAEATCPFKPGDILKGKRGLAVTGVQVTQVIAPNSTTPKNRWMVETVALSKAGEPTRRIVTFMELMAELDQLEKQ